MGMMQLSYWSQSVAKQSQMMVCFPDRLEAEAPYSVLYLLHGLSDDHTAWTRYTSIERYAAGLPLIVVMPDGHRSFYTDGVDGLAYEGAIIKDVVDVVEKFFNVRAERAGRAISGLSMGGYGAMKLGLKYPEMFASVAAHSSAFSITKIPEQRNDLEPEVRRIYGENYGHGGDDDCFALARNADQSTLPALRFDCGDEDFLIESNRLFHKHLTDIGIAHEYAEHPGIHNWAYWDEHVQESLAFHARNLGLCEAVSE